MVPLEANGCLCLQPGTAGAYSEGMVTVVKGIATKRGAFIVVESDEPAKELCRHRTEGQALKCARNACSSRFAQVRREAFAREHKAPGTV